MNNHVTFFLLKTNTVKYSNPFQKVTLKISKFQILRISIDKMKEFCDKYILFTFENQFTAFQVGEKTIRNLQDYEY